MPPDEARSRVFKPRQWSPEEQDQIRRQVHVLWRNLTLRSARDCPHTAGTMVEVENDHGVWAVVICNDCGLPQSGPECPHVHCTWHEDDRVLICDNCGVDAT